jgi:uncharacterized membrane protein
MRLSPLVIFHICCGSVGLLSGTLAMVLRKGSHKHVLAGKVFVVSMLGLAASGAIVGYMRSQTINMLMGSFTFYLVVTGWSAGRQRDGKLSAFDWGTTVAGLVITAGMMICGLQVAYRQADAEQGYLAGLYFFWGSVALLSVAGDFRMLVRGSLLGTQRIVRHLWRMNVAFLIAALSFFLGQQKVMPASWRGSKWLFVPPLLVLVMLIYWVVRVMFTKKYRRSGFPSRIPEARAEVY